MRMASIINRSWNLLKMSLSKIKIFVKYREYLHDLLNLTETLLMRQIDYFRDKQIYVYITCSKTQSEKPT